MTALLSQRAECSPAQLLHVVSPSCGGLSVGGVRAIRVEMRGKYLALPMKCAQVSESNNLYICFPVLHRNPSSVNALSCINRLKVYRLHGQ